jgi:hypothetical protein
MGYHKIPQADYITIKRMIGYQEQDNDQLPENLMTLYWHNRALYMKSYTGASVQESPQWLLHMVVQLWSMGGKLMKSRTCHMPPKPFSRTVKDLVKGQYIEVWFRHAWRRAEYSHVKGDGRTVMAMMTEEPYSKGGYRDFPIEECREREVAAEDIEEPEVVIA